MDMAVSVVTTAVEAKAAAAFARYADASFAVLE